MTGPVPNASTPITGAGGLPNRVWYTFFSQLRNGTSDPVARAQIAEILQRLDALEDGADADGLIMGLDSVKVYGTLADGLVSVTLSGDVDKPGNTYLYGTGPDGVKGWYLLGDAFDTETLAKVIDPTTGIVSFDLADLPDTGIGAALVKLTRDDYGRVEGTEAAVLDDLSDVDAAAPSTGDALVFDGANWAPGQVATEQLFQRMTPEADFRITADGNLRVTT